MRNDTLAQVLSTKVVEALVQIGLTQNDVLGGPIPDKYTMLPWQVPPLVIDAPLFGVPLSDYLDKIVWVNTDALYNMWSESLLNMKNHPHKVLSGDGYKGTSYATPSVLVSERQVHFSLPEGFPVSIGHMAGLTLSMECAHLLRSNSKLDAFVSDDDNYYAVLPEGAGTIGVKDGLPAAWEQDWDVGVSGLLQELIRAPRGEIWEGCDYNVISKVRALIHEYEKSLRDFEALEWAVQTLRVVDGASDLLAAVRNIRKVEYNRTARLNTLLEANDIAQRRALTDRQRVETLKQILVPDVLTAGQFSKTIYPFHQTPPAMLQDRALQRIQAAVNELYEEEERLYGRHKEPHRS